MSGGFEALPSDESREYIESITRSLDNPLSLDRVFYVYGSAVVNTLKETSDVDIMSSSNFDLDEPVRAQEAYQGRPISVYHTSPRAIKADGVKYEYGGYYTGKLLSPHIVLSKDESTARLAVNIANHSVGSFLSNFVQFDPEDEYEAEGIAAEAYGSYLRLYPWYSTYLIKFFQGPTDDEILKECMVSHAVICLEAAGIIQQTSESGASQPKYKAMPELPSRTSEEQKEIDYRATHRFWSHGAIMHGNNHKFIDFYIDKVKADRNIVDPTGKRWEELRQLLCL